jgi:hypothetical protein
MTYNSFKWYIKSQIIMPITFKIMTTLIFIIFSITFSNIASHFFSIFLQFVLLFWALDSCFLYIFF